MGDTPQTPADIQATIDTQSKAGDVVDKVKEKFKAAEEAYQKYVSGIIASKVPFENLIDTFGSMGLALANARAHVFELGDSFSALGAGVTDSSDKISQSIQPVLKLIGALKDIGAQIPGVGKLINLLGDGVTAVAEEFAAGADQAKTLELGYVQLAASTGNLGMAFGEAGQGVEALDKKLLKYTHDSIEMAKESGMSVKAISSFRYEIGQIPGAFTEANSAIVVGSETLNIVTAAAKVATVTFGGLAEVQRELGIAYDNLNKRGGAAMEFVASINEVAAVINKYGDDFSITVKDARAAVIDITSSFKFFGDSTQGALNLLTKFVPAFSEVGLSSSQTTKMITDMTSGIHGLDTASKAFISARSGGPGGLQGAFKIDKMIADGKIDEVVKMAQDSMKKQLGGGNVVTLGQASESAQAAQQYQRQLSFIKSSAFGSMIKNDDQASKFFEAMAKGKMDQVRPMVDQKTALQVQTKRGEDVQAMNRNRVDQMAKDVNHIAVNMAFFAKRTVQGLAGTNSALGGEVNRVQENAKGNARNATEKFNGSHYDNKTIFMTAMGMKASPKEDDEKSPGQNPPAIAAPKTDVVGPTGRDQYGHRHPPAPPGTPQGPAAGPSQRGPMVNFAVPANTAIGQRPKSPVPGIAPVPEGARGRPGAHAGAATALTITGKLDIKCPSCGNKTLAQLQGEAQDDAKSAPTPGYDPPRI